ncbi:MFS transporter [Dictyobacter alpinus]|uniref:MFS transporter n=1 Tax=Dictyobacter alpinus TaxID=2014873 RepID=A0A402BFR6_9CHLR|nr:MDR family MFS transporter [Dictyobacter alpinus]GCE30233.1 MFS transporter [Dictyobacter alpinus]
MHFPRISPKVSVGVVFVAAMFMSIMDSTIVNVALPSLAHDFGVAGTAIEAVVVAYLVSLAIVIPVSGWLGDRFGTKRIFLSALALFTIASALCGLATSLPMLVVFRVFQGLAGGALAPVGTALLYRTFPQEERIHVSRVLNIPTVFAPAMGPVIGGLLIDKLSWHWVFYVNVPIGVLAFVFGLLFLREMHERVNVGFDVAGFLLAGFGLALTMYALSEGPSQGWTNPGILISGALGLMTLVVFVNIELRVKQPMLDLRLLKNRPFRTCNTVALFSGAGFMGLLYAAPLFLQVGRGVSALTSGLTTFPEALGVLVSTQIAARLYPKVGPRRLVIFGLSCVTILMGLMFFVGQNTDLWLMRILMFLIGAGMASSFIPIQVAAFATISPAATGQASALNNARLQVGASLGVALISSVISFVGITQVNANGAVVANLASYHTAFIVSAILVLIATGIGFTIHDSDAASTMKSRPNETAKQDAILDVTPGVEAVL